MFSKVIQSIINKLETGFLHARGHDAPEGPFRCETDVGGVLVSTVCASEGVWSTVVFDEDVSFDVLTHSEDSARAMHDEAVTYARQTNEALEILKGLTIVKGGCP